MTLNRIRSLGPNTLRVGTLAINAKYNGLADVPNRFIANDILEHTTEHGGGTFDVSTTRECDEDGITDYSVDFTGHAVGGFLDTLKIDLKAVPWTDQLEKIALFIHRIPRGGDGNKLFYLGTWVEDDILYVDATKVFPLEQEQEAFETAENHGEIAVYTVDEDGNGSVTNVADYFSTLAAREDADEAKIDRLYDVTNEDVPVGNWFEDDPEDDYYGLTSLRRGIDYR
jgi:hypothetical protein